MTNTLLYIIIISILILLGFVSYFSLSKIPQKGKTKIILKIVLCKILQIEYKSEHNDNSKR